MRNETVRTRRSVKLVAFLLVAVVIFGIAEVFSSLILIYHYRLNGRLKEDDSSILSSVSLVNKAFADVGIFPPRNGDETLPHSMIISDDSLGWTLLPGLYSLNFKHRVSPYSDWEILPTKVTINSDRSRKTGAVFDPQKPTIYIFGDSAVFGTGVNDEQTFAYLLQLERPRYNVKLLAVPAYGLTNNYQRLLQLKNDIRPTDIVIIGYSEYYDIRNVAAPSHLREVDEHIKTLFPNGVPPRQDEFAPKAELIDGNRLVVSMVEQDCHVVVAYCKQSDPSQSYMTAVSAHLINEMGRSTAAKTILLHIDAGHPNLASKSSPIFKELDPKIDVVSALQEDFGYYMEDLVLHFDAHPGPYWHYAISRKLLSVIQ